MAERSVTGRMPPPIRPAVVASPDYPFVPVEAEVKLDQNESPDDFPAALKSIVLQQLADMPWHRYPDLQAESLCEAIAGHEAWPVEGVIATTGSNVLIALLTQLAGLNRSLLTVKPNFALYALDGRLLESRVTEVPLAEDLSVDAPAVIQRLRQEPAGGVLFLAQPLAPSGAVTSATALQAIVGAAPQWLVVIDEAYRDFAGTDARALALAHDNVVLLRTFSKAWGLAGIRLGYALAPVHIARHLRKLVPPFGLSVMQSVTAQVALANPGYRQERVALIVRERERVAAALRGRADWRVYPSGGNFLLIRTPDAAAAHAELLTHGVLVRRQDSYHGLQGCIRMTIGARADNDRFLRAAGLGS